jgi:NAD(P)-dependent dehydrogenase (short-subunit alcohol dehydrogenase family)
MKLKGKVVLITDGASPSGREIAARLGAEGAVLALNVFPPAEETAPEGGMLIHADPASKTEIRDTVAAVLLKYGRIDILIHNNNEVIPALLEDANDEIYERSIAVNMKSAFHYVRAAGTAMKAAESGNFIFVSSIHDEKPSGGAFAYSIAKGCLKMLAKEMVLDMGPYNIRTNIIDMGPLEGEEDRFYSDLSPLYEHARDRIGNGKFGNDGDIAAAVLFLAGEDSLYANGSELRLDGGFLLTYFARRKLKNIKGENHGA